MDTGHWSALPVEEKVSNSIIFFINSFQILINQTLMGDGSIYSSGLFSVLLLHSLMFYNKKVGVVKSRRVAAG